MTPCVVVLLFSAALTLRAVAWARFQTWWAFSRTAATVAVVALMVEFGFISVIALAALAQQWPGEAPPDLVTSVSAVALLHASVRRANHEGRAATLLLGLTAKTLDAVDQHVVALIERRLRHMPFDQLLDLSDRVNARLTADASTHEQIEYLSKLRTKRTKAAQSRNANRKAASEAQLVAEVSRGWMAYTMGNLS